VRPGPPAELREASTVQHAGELEPHALFAPPARDDAAV
jgi:hypothetical protein